MKQSIVILGLVFFSINVTFGQNTVKYDFKSKNPPEIEATKLGQNTVFKIENINRFLYEVKIESKQTEFHSEPEEKEISFLIPMGLLTAMIFLIGIFPSLVSSLFLENALKQFMPGNLTTDFNNFLSVLATLTNIFLAFAGLVFFLLLIRFLLLKGRHVKEFKTWDCGYQVQSSRIQYTSSSYAQPFLHLVSELVPQKIKVNKEHVLFPKEAHLESHAQDFSERYLVQPALKFIDMFMNLFSWIQSGKMQQYIVYGLLFLIFLLIWIIGAA